MFEVLRGDLAGRIGVLHTNHGTVETPAFVPVVHPTKQSIPPSEIRDMGFEMVITNAYIAIKNLREEAERRGIHDLIGFEGSVMTDSGGYQVLEYGSLEITPEEIAAFETSIETDIAVPLDRPTGFGLTRREAISSVKKTLADALHTIQNVKENGQIWTGPIQGGDHLDLVRRSAKALVRQGFPMLALGSPVEFMESYEYRMVASMITAAREAVPCSLPLHLFGAGHPLTIPLAVALGCDTFDSASYMLYARQGRYITEDGTRNISEMRYFSCSCPVCLRYTPQELSGITGDEGITHLARHNLYMIRAEVLRVREAIHEGRLWEYTMRKARAHPRLYDAIGVITSHAKKFIDTTPRFKSRAVFLFCIEDQFRPEVLSYHQTARRFRTKKSIICITRDAMQKPAYISARYSAIRERFEDPGNVQFCQYNPYLGIIPIEISDIYPASHYMTVCGDPRPDECVEFANTWETFFAKNRFECIYYNKGDRFLEYFLKMLPDDITLHPTDDHTV